MYHINYDRWIVCILLNRMYDTMFPSIHHLDHVCNAPGEERNGISTEFGIKNNNKNKKKTKNKNKKNKTPPRVPII